MTQVSVKELNRIKQTAIAGAAWDKKISSHKATVAPVLEANFDASYQAVCAAQPAWVEVEGVQCLQSPGGRMVAVPVSGRKNSRYFDVINLDDRSDIVCQLKSSEVNGWLVKQVIAAKS